MNMSRVRIGTESEKPALIEDLDRAISVLTRNLKVGRYDEYQMLILLILLILLSVFNFFIFYCPFLFSTMQVRSIFFFA